MGRGGQVAGYAIANDVSARDLQFDSDSGQWTRGKGGDTFCPWGPWITTEDEVPDLRDLRLRTYVNGELRQDATTADLIFGVDEIIAHIQEVARLEPGDLILTGTPAGVGYGREPKVALAPGPGAHRDRPARFDRAPDHLALHRARRVRGLGAVGLNWRAYRPIGSGYGRVAAPQSRS